MSDPQSPSPVIECFVRSVGRDFPDAEQVKLKVHQPAIARTTSRGDAHRARRCAEWAIEMAADKSQSHPRWREVKEAHRVWKDTWFGLEFGLEGVLSRVVGAAMPFEDVKIEWTEDAVAVAKALGEEDGWDHSPWEALLVELIEIDTPHPTDSP